MAMTMTTLHTWFSNIDHCSTHPITQAQYKPVSLEHPYNTIKNKLNCFGSVLYGSSRCHCVRTVP